MPWRNDTCKGEFPLAYADGQRVRDNEFSVGSLEDRGEDDMSQKQGI